MKHFILPLLCSLAMIVTNCRAASETQNENHQNLESELTVALESLDGQAGLFVEHFDSGFEYAYNADTVFTSASLVKVPIMIGIYDRLESGEYEFREEFKFKEEYKPESFVHLTGNLKPETEVPLSELLMLMMSFSDNTASLWLQELAGGGEGINELMEKLGTDHTRVNSRTEGREDSFDEFGWGQTTPREMTQLMEQIYKRDLFSHQASESMYRVLSRTYYQGEALSQIPAEINVASKQGAVSHSRSETVIVNAPSGSYAFTLLTQNQNDTSWDFNNEGYKLIRQVSHILWEYFGDDTDYTPPDDDMLKKWY